MTNVKKIKNLTNEWIDDEEDIAEDKRDFLGHKNFIIILMMIEVLILENVNVEIDVHFVYFHLDIKNIALKNVHIQMRM